MINDFFDGLTSYGRAFRAISKMGLWGYALIPALITLILMIGIGLSAFNLSDDLGGFLIGWWKWDIGSAVIAKIGSWVGGFVIAIIGILSLKYIVMITVAPFMSILSEKVEAKMIGKKDNSSFSVGEAIKDILRGIKISFRNIIREFFFTLLLLIFGLIPVIGWISPVFIFLLQSYYAGFGNADYTLERHFKVRQSVTFAKQHKGLMIGNGVVFMALLMTGIGFLIAPPLSTVAATLESIERLDAAGYVKMEESELV